MAHMKTWWESWRRDWSSEGALQVKPWLTLAIPMLCKEPTTRHVVCVHKGVERSSASMLHAKLRFCPRQHRFLEGRTTLLGLYFEIEEAQGRIQEHEAKEGAVPISANLSVRTRKATPA
jgi:hypothetical protein